MRVQNRPAHFRVGLKAYKAKRDFERSPEPAGKTGGDSGRLFVIQKHAASRWHYDFRLEMDGVLKSWAVPKGIPLQKADRRLAVEVEDHPLDYANFEGIIPPGNYGAGTVMVWDTGTYELLEHKPGHLRIALHGRKLEGQWTLVQMKNTEKDWLLIKSAADAKPIRGVDESALTSRSMEQIAADRGDFWHSHHELNDLPRAVPRFVEPMKAKPVTALPKGKWVYEIKFDGIRVLAVKRGDAVQLYSRNERSLTGSFPEIVAALGRLPCAEAVFDGEIVALDENGRSSFQLMQPFIHGRGPRTDRPPMAYYFFDLLNLEGRDLAGLPLVNRRAVLEKLLPAGDALLRYSASFQKSPAALLKEIKRLGLEGLVGKRPDSRYEPGKRSGQWIKIKCTNEQEFVIGGYTPPQGTRQHFGSLVVGYYEGDRLLYASKVGSGFADATLASLYRQFQTSRVPACPFANLPSRRGDPHGISAAEMKRCGWVTPEQVCQVRFTEWTDDGHLRHPVFLGLRADKAAREVGRE